MKKITVTHIYISYQKNDIEENTIVFGNAFEQTDHTVDNLDQEDNRKVLWALQEWRKLPYLSLRNINTILLQWTVKKDCSYWMSDIDTETFINSSLEYAAYTYTYSYVLMKWKVSN